MGVASCSDSVTAPPPPDYDFDPLAHHIEAALDTLKLAHGVAIVLIQKGHVIYEQGFGKVTPSTPVPLASAAKWLTAVTVLTLVDDRVLALETPMGEVLPETFYTAGIDDGKDRITIRQLLSQTAGIPPHHPCVYQDSRTLRECMLFIGSRALVRPPGTAFIYGQPTFTVAGAAAEEASGRSWNDVFERGVAGPLGMTTVDFLGNDNPQLGDGAVGSARDYARMLERIADGGLLSSGLVEEMLRDQTAGTEVVSTPRDPSLGYGLGVWIEREAGNGRALRVSSPGSSGFWPWIDFERDLVGVIAAPPRIEVTGELIADILGMVEQIVPVGAEIGA